MKSWRRFLILQAVFCLCLGVILGGRSAGAQTLYNGFAVNRYQPSSAGEWSFAVDHPWYSSTRYFAAGITLGYAHSPLILRTASADGSFAAQTAVIDHQFLGQIDVAGSFLDRVQINGSMPIVFLERGTDANGAAPANGVAAGDPRLGLWVRAFGQPYRSPVSLSIGAQVWVPIRAGGLKSGVALTSSDEGVLRILPKIALGGLSKRLLWSVTAGFQYRPAAQLGSGADPVGSTVGSELQLGVAIAYADFERRFAIGPEIVFATTVLGVDETRPFSYDYSSIDFLLAGHYNIARQINLGLAAGIAQLNQTGTPDARFLFRLAYAPMKEMKEPTVDRDHDGIPDKDDACLDEVGIASADPRNNGCPDRDRDGVIDPVDICPTVPQGARPDQSPQRLGCPVGDRDNDGILDPEDLCPDAPKGDKPDPSRLGCPAGDRDKDGVVDPEDLCPDAPKGDKPDPNKIGCPAGDRDKDGVADHEDLCPDTAKGDRPDPNKAGCPAADRDKDYVIDVEDACPDQAGAPDPDPKKNGCPGVTTISNGQININTPVFFAKDNDEILKRSFPVLESVASTIKIATAIKKVRVEGHTDNRGKADHNRDLSARRARSVLRFLVEKGIAEGRLEAAGIGPDRPITDNKSRKGRDQNRRVDFMIIDPPKAQGAQISPVDTLTAPKTAVVHDKPGKGDKKNRHHRKKIK